MIKTSNISRIFRLSLLIAGTVFASGYLTTVIAQSSRDPFEKAPYARPKPVVMPGSRIDKDGKLINDNWTNGPSIEQRIDYYKRLRAAAAASGASLPKVTSVLTLNELAVTGIFRTPRGYAAMVEATPIKLSYTIYPGEKFFDGQLVAVEENQLVFRKVTKTGTNKFASSVENKPLRKYTERQELQGTAPQSQTEASNAVPSSMLGAPKAMPAAIVSPLDEMNSQPAAPAEKTKAAHKPAKVARNK